MIYDFDAPGVRISRAAGAGVYDAFPSVATDGKASALIGWQQGKMHDDPSASAVVRLLTNYGKTMGAPVVVSQGTSSNKFSIAGLTWNNTAGAWLAYVNSTAYADGKVSSRGGMVMSSKDGATWGFNGPAPTWPSNNWYFPSDVAWVDDGSAAGALYLTSYASVSGVSSWVTLVIVSRDGGQTWTDAGFPLGPGGIAMVEPRFAVHDGTITVTTRNDAASQIHATTLQSDGTWSAPQVAASQATGEANMLVTRDGTRFLMCRDATRPIPDGGYNAHYPFKMLRSDDTGQTWTSLGDVTNTGKCGMYQGLAQFDDGSILIAYGAEDDPNSTWATSAIWVMRAAPETVSAKVATVAGGLPVVRIDTATGQAFRRPPGGSWTQVRPVMRDGLIVDAEAPPGVTEYAPSTRSGAATVTVRVPPVRTLWLVVPAQPELSVPLRIKDDGAHAWQQGRTVNTLEIPGHAPHSIDFGVSGRTGTIVVWALNGREYDALTAALDVPGPKYLACPDDHWILAKAPRWVTVTSTQEQAFGFRGQEPKWQVSMTVTPAERTPVVAATTQGWAALSEHWADLASTWAAMPA